MQLEPHEIESKTFSRTWRGYDPDEVRAFLADVAATVRDDDDYRRAGIEVARALREMHRIVNDVRAQVEHEASSLRRQAIIDAEELLSEARRSADQLLLESEEAAGNARFEAAAWATKVRAEAEVERQEADAHLAEVRREVARLEDELGARAEAAVEQAIRARELDAERVERRIDDLHAEELTVVGRLRRIHREIAALVETPIDTRPTPLPARREAVSSDGVVLDLTGTSGVEAAVQAGLRRGLAARRDR